MHDLRQSFLPSQVLILFHFMLHIKLSFVVLFREFSCKYRNNGITDNGITITDNGNMIHCRPDRAVAGRAASEGLRSGLRHLPVHRHQHLRDHCLEGLLSRHHQHRQRWIPTRISTEQNYIIWPWLYHCNETCYEIPLPTKFGLRSLNIANNIKPPT